MAGARSAAAWMLPLLLGAAGCGASLTASSVPDQASAATVETDASTVVDPSGPEKSRAGDSARLHETPPDGTPPSPERRGSRETDARKPKASAPSSQSALVGIARKYLGVPYKWGGWSPEGFDCSGFVSYVYAKVGISIPHNVAQQYRFGTHVSMDRLKPGDLVFFDRLRHNGIYIGRGQFIHAARTGGIVGISRLDESWFKSRWVGGRRLLGQM